MKKKLLFLLSVLFVFPLMLNSCKKKVEPIIVDGKSTIINTTKKVEDFKDDYKNILYAYLGNFQKYKSLEATQIGTLDAKVLFVNYHATFEGHHVKKNNSYYIHSISKSSLVNVDQELYETSTKVVQIRDEKEKIYDKEDYLKQTYSSFDALLDGLLCNDKSIIGASLETKTSDTYTFKYIFDVNEATPYLKMSLKYNGDLVDYPEYISASVYLTMKNDFTPVKLVFDSSYNAKKPLIGSGLVEQHLEATYDKLNQEVIVPNEAKFIELAGQEASEIEDTPLSNATELLNGFKGLPYSSGTALKGTINSDILKSSGVDLTIKTDLELVVDVENILNEKVYNFGNVYLEVETDENVSMLLSLVGSFVGEELGEYASLLNELKFLKIYYLGDGYFYFEATNGNGLVYYMYKLKLTDIIDKLLQSISINEIIDAVKGDISNQYLEYVREDIDEHTYKINLVLNEEYINKVKDFIEGLFEKQPFVKSLLEYKSFGGIEASVIIKDEVFNGFSGKVTYINESDELVSIIDINAQIEEFTHGFEQDNYVFDELVNYEAYKVFESKVNDLKENFYLDKIYKQKALKILEEYESLDSSFKELLKYNVEELTNQLGLIDENIEYLFTIRNSLTNLDKLNNQEIYDLCYAYQHNQFKTLISETIGLETMGKYDEIANYVNYLDIENELANIDPSAEISTWGLSEERINEYKVLFKIANMNNEVSNRIIEKLGPLGFISYIQISAQLLN